jgi:hypothetical protein
MLLLYGGVDHDLHLTCEEGDHEEKMNPGHDGDPLMLSFRHSVEAGLLSFLFPQHISRQVINSITLPYKSATYKIGMS